MRLSLALSLFAVAVGLSPAQSNQTNGIDVSLGILSGMTRASTSSGANRVGTYPAGTTAFAVSTTSCNLGTLDVPWVTAGTSTTVQMSEDHPFIAFMALREMNGRFQQISNFSFVKHGFYALSSSQCTPCLHPSNGSFLGVGCSDTYAVSNNSDNTWLAPAPEIDVWLGTWNHVGTYFDKGALGTGTVDGLRSLVTSQIPVPGNRMLIKDADLNLPGASYYYTGQYVIRAEPEIVRENNIASRSFTSAWSGTQWNITTTGTQQQGSVLQRWTGATVTSGLNGGDDGRVYVAVKVTQNANGTWHYEYAMHNRDNTRGVNAIHLPVCSTLNVSGFGFHDVDTTAANDWTLTRNGDDMVIGTSTYAVNNAANYMSWNEVFNFWFDSTGGPAAVTSTFDEYKPGTGAPTFTVATTGPAAYVRNLGAGCGTGNLPVLAATDSAQPRTPRASLGNATFGMSATSCGANAPCLFVFSSQLGSVDLGGGCSGYVGGDLSTDATFISVNSSALGVLALSFPVPNDPGAEGLNFFGQVACPGTGFAGYNLSNGVQIYVGSTSVVCP